MTQQRYTTLGFPSINKFSVGFDHLFNELSRANETLSHPNYPPYDIIKLSDTDYTISLAVAGFKEDELNVEEINRDLIITGRRAETIAETVNNNAEFLHKGISTRNFERSFALAENVQVKEGTVTNGILSIALEVVIPESEKPRQISLTFAK